jgi:hypothetical protein
MDELLLSHKRQDIGSVRGTTTRARRTLLLGQEKEQQYILIPTEQPPKEKVHDRQRSNASEYTLKKL